MKRINFTKMVASGNDFAVLENMPKYNTKNLSSLARIICDRKFGAGADGLLVLERKERPYVGMRIFNADGSEAEMCGNGARCATLYLGKKKVKLLTKAGMIISELTGGGYVKIKLTKPSNIKTGISLEVNGRSLKVDFIDTGVPHTIVFVEGLKNIGVLGLGRALRYHKRFSPKGTNVDFVEVLNTNSIKVRTYERGVENETLACGTGSVASALLFIIKNKNRLPKGTVYVHTEGGEVLKVYYRMTNSGFSDVWLEGLSKIVYKGVYYV